MGFVINLIQFKITARPSTLENRRKLYPPERLTEALKKLAPKASEDS